MTHTETERRTFILDTTPDHLAKTLRLIRMRMQLTGLRDVLVEAEETMSGDYEITATGVRYVAP